SAPARAAATAWAAPLPPGARLTLTPSTVSPGLGRRVTIAVVSMLSEPTTQTLAWFILSSVSDPCVGTKERVGSEDLDDLEPFHAPRRVDSDDLAHAGLHEGLAHRAVGGDLDDVV